MVLTESTPVFFSNNSTSRGTQATWLDTSILRSSLFFTRKSVTDSLASGNPIRSNFPIRIGGDACPPLGIRFVFVYGRAGLRLWIDNPPGLLHIIFAGEERGVSRHCVSKDSFVSVHLPGARVPAGQQLRQIAL